MLVACQATCQVGYQKEFTSDLPPHWCVWFFLGSCTGVLWIPLGLPMLTRLCFFGEVLAAYFPKQGEPSVSPAGCLLGSRPCLALLSFWYTSCQKGGLSAGPSVPRAQMLGFGGKFAILCSLFIFIYVHLWLYSWNLLKECSERQSPRK